MDNFEEQMEDRLIEKQIEDEEQEMHELLADLSDDQKKVYKAMSNGKNNVREHIYILKSILSDYQYEIKRSDIKKYTGENQ